MVQGDARVSEAICEEWAKHFEALVRPASSTDYDDQYLERAHEDNIITNLNCECPSHIEPASIEEVLAAINKIHNNKAPDVMGYTSEHINLAKRPSAEVIKEVINFCLSTRAVPDFLKQMILTPMYNK